jgi:hypothetical protein
LSSFGFKTAKWLDEGIDDLGPEALLAVLSWVSWINQMSRECEVGYLSGVSHLCRP